MLPFTIKLERELDSLRTKFFTHGRKKEVMLLFRSRSDGPLENGVKIRFK